MKWFTTKFCDLKVGVFALGGLISSLPAASREWSSTVEQVPLVELYSSQGCSSCPPAELWMSQLTKKKDLWQRFVPVAFHVDYWDYLGWKDPFASERFSERERHYAASWNARTVYTPCVVVAGKEYRNWSTGLAGLPGKEVGALTLKIEDKDTFQLKFAPVNKDENSYLAHVAWLGFGLSTHVTRGENAGATLQSDFVVLRHDTKPMTSSSNLYGATIKLPLPTQKTALAAVAWIENARGEPVQAVGGYMTE